MLGVVLHRLRRVRPATAFPFTLGVFSGTLITTFLVLAIRSIDNETDRMRERLGQPMYNAHVRKMPALPHEEQDVRVVDHDGDSPLTWKKPVFYDIISSKASFTSRGYAIFRTWGSTRSKSLSFSLFPPGEDKEMNFAFKKRIPVNVPKRTSKEGRVTLLDYQGIFSTWRHVCENKQNEYHWYAAVQDTVYLRVEILENILSKLNSSKNLIIGHSITPLGQQKDELGLKDGENYCMGAGYVISNSALKAVCPWLNKCQQNAMSENENVEFARCIRIYARTNCTSATEMQELFYQADGLLAEEELQLGQHYLNPATKKAALLSPLVEPDHFFHLHQYYSSQEFNTTKLNSKIMREHMIRTAEKGARSDSLLHTNEHQSPSWTKLGVNFPYNAKTMEDLIHWKTLDDQYVYTEAKFYPNLPLSTQVKQDTSDILRAMKLETSDSLKVDSIFQRIDPQRGLDYFLHTIEKHTDSAYNPRFLHALREAEPPRVTSVSEASYKTTKVNFIVPAPPVSRAFQRFMISFESGFLARNPQELVGLLVILYSDGSFRNYDKDIFASVTLLDLYKTKYPGADLRLITTRRPYSRKESIELAALEFPTYELLFLADIHIDFSRQFLERCRMNAHEGQQVYFPAVFSLYDPSDYYKQRIRNPYATRFKLSYEHGSWMHESFHLTCVYNYDLIEALQLGKHLQESEWSLLNLFIEYKKLTIFRAMEPGLLHLWQDGCKEEQLGQMEKILCSNIIDTE